MLRIGPAADRGGSEVVANILIRGKRTSGGAVVALAVTGAFGGDAEAAQRNLASATFCAIDNSTHNM